MNNYSPRQAKLMPESQASKATEIYQRLLRSYIEIIHIETIQSPSRSVSPVGLYLIWYAAKTSLDFDCTRNDSGSIVELDALESAIDYYRDKVMMERRGWISIVPGEEGYAFRFSQAQAIEFCTRIEQ